jgi:hypothetical protein
VLNFLPYREKSSSASSERSARLAIRRRRIGGGEAAVRRAQLAAKRACRNGMVKNQQCSATEVLQIKASEAFAVLNFLQSR